MPFTRYVPEWSGMSGAPGYSVFHFQGTAGPSDAAALSGLVRAMFDSMKTFLPNDVTIAFPGEATTHSDDGTLTGAVAVTPIPANVVGSDTGTFSAPSGLRVQWDTGVIVGGRRLRGRTFIVPLAGLAYENNGTIQPTVITNYTGYAQTLVNASTTAGFPLAVWSQVGSVVHPVTTATIPDQATVLRSRRD